jgi:hypothetical protein
MQTAQSESAPDVQRNCITWGVAAARRYQGCEPRIPALHAQSGGQHPLQPGLRVSSGAAPPPGRSTRPMPPARLLQRGDRAVAKRSSLSARGNGTSAVRIRVLVAIEAPAPLHDGHCADDMRRRLSAIDCRSVRRRYAHACLVAGSSRAQASQRPRHGRPLPTMTKNV